jgi:excisionase family DNA binding protein
MARKKKRRALTNDPNAMDVHEAAAFLGAHIESIRRLARRGALPSFKLGHVWRFRRDAIERWFEAQGPRGNTSILILDDEAPVCQMIGRMVERLGFRSVKTTSAIVALQHVAKETPNLIILDLFMPEMNGPEFLKQIRKNHPDLPVVIVTAFPDSELMLKAMQYGPFTLIPKPINESQLAYAIQMTIGKDLVRQPLRKARNAQKAVAE